MQSNSLIIKVFMVFLILYSSNSRADNPSSIFGITLGQDILELFPIEKFGSMYMNFKVTPEKPIPPFDLYSVKVDNNFNVLSISARGKVPAEECTIQLNNIASKIEISLGLTLNKSMRKDIPIFTSEDDETIMGLYCDRYRSFKHKGQKLKDVVLILVPKKITTDPKPAKMDKASKARLLKIVKILGEAKAKRREIEIVSKNDLSGGWSTDCTNNQQGIAIGKIRDNFYHFSACKGNTCRVISSISSDDVEVMNAEHLKIMGKDFKFCSALD